MRRSQIYFIIVIISLIIILFGFQYIVSIYEVDISVSQEVLYADSGSECIIRTVPVNSLGMKALFRNAPAKIEIAEGRDLIDIIVLDEKNGILKIKARDRYGKVVIHIKPEKALLPTSIEIKILPNAA